MLLAALLLFQTAPCAATDANLPAALAGWTVPGSNFDAGEAITLDWSDGVNVILSGPAHRPGKVKMISFRVKEPGIYGIALDQPGWVDVIPGRMGTNKPLVSASHGHGPECSTIRKVVRFQLDPGDHRLVLTGLAGPNVRVMLVRGD